MAGPQVAARTRIHGGDQLEVGRESKRPFGAADGDSFICPECFHEWSASTIAEASSDDGDGIIRDANGNPLSDGDSVILIKDLKVKGSSIVLKKGAKVKSIRLGNASDGHEVDCRMDVGNFMLKACFLKKA